MCAESQNGDDVISWLRTDCARTVSSSPRRRSPSVPVRMIRPGIRVVVGGSSTVSGSLRIIPNTPPDPEEGLESWRRRDTPPLTLEGNTQMLRTHSSIGSSQGGGETSPAVTPVFTSSSIVSVVRNKTARMVVTAKGPVTVTVTMRVMIMNHYGGSHCDHGGSHCGHSDCYRTLSELKPETCNIMIRFIFSNCSFNYSWHSYYSSFDVSFNISFNISLRA